MDDFLFFSFKFIYFIVYFIFGRVGSSLLRAGFSLVGERGATLCGARASHCGGFSCCRARALGARASVVVAHRLSSCGLRALECRLCSCGARAQLLCGMWESSQTRARTRVPCIGMRTLNHCATREAPDFLN